MLKDGIKNMKALKLEDIVNILIIHTSLGSESMLTMAASIAS